METLLARVTGHAVNYAIRSGITITATYAIAQCGRLLKEAPRNTPERDELLRLQARLENKIRILSPAIDMIELISARGNTSLESAVTLTKDIRSGIQLLATDLSQNRHGASPESILISAIAGMKVLLSQIEDSVPLINLAITTSGVNLTTKLSGGISPSRLLQASTFLSAADSQYTLHPGSRQQVGPTYNLSIYMLFAGHAGREGRETTWKEVIHRARLQLIRVPLGNINQLSEEESAEDNLVQSLSALSLASEFAYQLVITEDLEDGRIHDDAAIRDFVPIHQISKVFYADTGKILNIDHYSDSNSPVLLLKRDVHASPPRRMQSDPTIRPEPAAKTKDTNTRRLPADLDPEWIALEVYAETSDSDSDQIDPESDASSSPSALHNQSPPTIRTSISLLEMLIKLTSLQQFRQQSHLAIEDELLNFFLENSATAGAGPDKDYRQRLRHDAIERVGFDPYDESPIKRRSEEYIAHPRGIASPRPSFDADAYTEQFPYDDKYGYSDPSNAQRPHSPFQVHQDSPLTPASAPQFVNLLRQTPSRSSTPGSFVDTPPATSMETPCPNPEQPGKAAPYYGKRERVAKGSSLRESQSQDSATDEG